MGFFSAIGSFISGVASAIGSVCSAIGLAPIGTALTAAITALNPIIGLIIAAIPLVNKLLEMFAPEEVEPREVESGKLVVMAEECRDIKPDNYETTSGYIKAVRESIETNPEKRARVDERMETLQPEERTAYQLVSVGLAGKLIAEKLGTDDLDPGFLGKANAMGLGPDETVSLVRGLGEEGMNTSDASRYFDGSLKGADFERASTGIKAAMEKVDPALATEDQKNAALNGMWDKLDAAIAAEKAKTEGSPDA